MHSRILSRANSDTIFAIFDGNFCLAYNTYLFSTMYCYNFIRMRQISWIKIRRAIVGNIEVGFSRNLSSTACKTEFNPQVSSL